MRRRRGRRQQRAIGGGGGGSTESMDTSNWEIVLELVQTVFRGGRLEEEAIWQAVVLIPKGGGLLPWHWPRGGDVEGSGRNFKFPAHSLHHLPRLPPQILGG